MQVRMTIMRHQIRCLALENDAVATEIGNDCDSLTFQCGCAQEWFVHAHHVKCDLCQNSSTTVRPHVPIHKFLFVVLQRHVVCCRWFFSFEALVSQGIVVQTMVDGHARKKQNRSSTRAHVSVLSAVSTLTLEVRRFSLCLRGFLCTMVAIIITFLIQERGKHVIVSRNNSKNGAKK